MYVRLFILNETRCYILGETFYNGFRHTEIEIRQSKGSTDQLLSVSKLRTDNTSQQKKISGLRQNNTYEGIKIKAEFNLS